MTDHSTFIGMDVHKNSIDIALAHGNRSGNVRHYGRIDGLSRTCRAALVLLLEKEPASSICRDLAQLTVPARKYRSQRRKTLLVCCRQLLLTHLRFRQVFQVCLFTKFRAPDMA